MQAEEAIVGVVQGIDIDDAVILTNPLDSSASKA